MSAPLTVRNGGLCAFYFVNLNQDIALSMFLCLSAHCVLFNHEIIRFNSFEFVWYQKSFHQFLAQRIYWYRMPKRQASGSITRTIAIFASSSSPKYTSRRWKRRHKDKEFIFFWIESIFLLSVLNGMILLNLQSHRLRSKVFPLNNDKEPATQITIYCLQMSVYHITLCSV